MNSGFTGRNSKRCGEVNPRKRKTSVDESPSMDSPFPVRRLIRSATSEAADQAAISKTAGAKIGVNNIDAHQKFPPRLMDVTEIPPTGKITTYSKAEHLIGILGVLRGTIYYDPLLNSPLGSIFRLRASKAALSGKLLHQMFCRMLVTNKRYEMWVVFANQPIRFSLKEFAVATGLPCGPYPKGKEIAECKRRANSNNAYWNELMVGSLSKGYLKDIAGLLWSDESLEEERASLPLKTKLRLCLVLLIDGVLCPKSSTLKASRFTVEMVRDVGTFIDYPWGRYSFELTMDSVRVGMKSNNSVNTMIHRLKRQTHFTVKGLSIAFQLVFFATIPAFEKFASPHDGDNDPELTDPNLIDLDIKRQWSTRGILKVDKNPKTKVTSILEPANNLDGVDLTWPDEVVDHTVENIINSLAVGYVFKEQDWRKMVNVAPQAYAPSNRNFLQSSRTTRSAKSKSMSRKPPVSGGSSEFVYNPADPIHNFYYTVVTPIFKDLIQTLVENTKAQEIFEVEESLDASILGSESLSDSESLSESVDDGSKPKDKGKGKAEVAESEDEVEILGEEEFELMGDGTVGTSGIHVANVFAPEPPEINNPVAPQSLAELMVDEDVHMTEVNDVGHVAVATQTLASLMDSDNEDKSEAYVLPKGPIVLHKPTLNTVSASEKSGAEALVTDFPVDWGLGEVEQSKLAAFFKAIDNYKPGQYFLYDMCVPRGIFREIATPQNPVSAMHIDLMIAAVNDRVGADLLANRSVILGTTFVKEMLDDAVKYKTMQDNQMNINQTLQHIIAGTHMPSQGPSAWLVDVDRVYAPMNWSSTHWVGLCIDLVSGKINVFDSRLDDHHKDAADALMGPILEMLPLMIAGLVAGRGAAVFEYSRLAITAKHADAGDGGPLSVKCMELHSIGAALEPISAVDVGNIRKNLAVDVYERFYTPLV